MMDDWSDCYGDGLPPGRALLPGPNGLSIVPSAWSRFPVCCTTPDSLHSNINILINHVPTYHHASIGPCTSPSKYPMFSSRWLQSWSETLWEFTTSTSHIRLINETRGETEGQKLRPNTSNTPIRSSHHFVAPRCTSNSLEFILARSKVAELRSRRSSTGICSTSKVCAIPSPNLRG